MTRFLVYMTICLLTPVALANQDCKITTVTSAVTTTDKEFTFKNRLTPLLNIYTETPESTIMGGDPILIFKNNRHISFQKINQYFGDSEDLPKILSSDWAVDCKLAIPKIIKRDYQILVTPDEKTLEGKERFSVFILNSKFNDHYHLLSFIGYTQEEVIKMLIKD